MSRSRRAHDFEIHVDQDCLSPAAMEEPTSHIQETTTMDQPAEEPVPAVGTTTEHTDDASPAAETEGWSDPTVDSLLDELIGGDGPAEEHEPSAEEEEGEKEQDEKLEGLDAGPEATTEEHRNEVDHEEKEEEDTVDEHESADGSSELDFTSIMDSVNLERRHSLRTEALIQAAARAVVSMRQGGQDDDNDEHEEQDHHESADQSVLSSTTDDHEGDTDDDTLQLEDDHDHDLEDDATSSRPESSASYSLRSPTEEYSVGDGAYSNSHHGAEDDVFSDHTPLSSRNSADDHCDNNDDDAFEQMTEKGSDSPRHARSRVVSGVSMSAPSETSELSRLSRYEKEDFVPTSRSTRPAFRSPSSVRALQMSSPTPSVCSAQARSPKAPTNFPTVSRLGSPTVSGQFPPKGRSTPSRFKRQEAPLVLLHVTLLPLRWPYGDVLDHFEAKKSAPAAFSSEGMKNLRGAWRQVQDRLGDTVLERGILLPHPQSDFEILEERLLEALELPLGRRARILECGHYLGPSNNMSVPDDIDSESEYMSDADESESGRRPEKRHWCTTCRGDIRYDELSAERVFRIKVYASNGLMSAGAWETCWKEMERVDIEVEPIVDAGVQVDLAKLGAAMDREHQQRLEDEQSQQMEEEQRMQLEVEQRLSLEQERQELESQRLRFEEEQRQALEESQRKLEEERRRIEEEQRQRLEEERRLKFEEDRRLLEAQRQEFEEQRLELEEQRKLIEEEQRQHLEESRRQELEVEHKILDEQRQELEEARQQFEEEQRQMGVAAPRSTSRTSYAEDDLSSLSRDGATSTELGARRRQSDRLREIYGHDRSSSSEGMLNNSSSPSIHIHVDTNRQREEGQNSRQLATIPATPRDSSSASGMPMLPMQEATSRHPSDSFMPPPSSPPPSSQQAFQQQQQQRKALDAASLPELVGETIRVLLQDPKNVAIAILVVALAMLAGQYGKGQERGVDIYTQGGHQQHHYQSPPHHHQLDSREPVGQVIMNTPPAVQQPQAQAQTQSQLVETIYKTVTAEPSQKHTVSRDVEVVYHTVTQHAPPPPQETPTRVVETIYSTVTESVVGTPPPPPAQAVIEPPSQDAGEFALPPPPTTGATGGRAVPSVDLNYASLDSFVVHGEGDDIATPTPSPSPSPLHFTPVGLLDPFICPLLSFPPSEPDSDDQKLKKADDTYSEVALEEQNEQDQEVNTQDADDTKTLLEIPASGQHSPGTPSALPGGDDEVHDLSNAAVPQPYSSMAPLFTTTEANVDAAETTEMSSETEMAVEDSLPEAKQTPLGAETKQPDEEEQGIQVRFGGDDYHVVGVEASENICRVPGGLW